MRFGQLAVLRYGGFTTFLFARLLSTIGAQMQGVAVGWQIYDKTHDVRNLGYVGLSLFLPFLIFILPSGGVADRYNRRRVLAVTVAVHAASAAALFALTVGPWLGVWPIFGVLFVLGSARAFAMPAGQALVPNLVPLSQLGSAVALSTSTFHAAVILGPVVGGFLYLLGPAVVYLTVVVLQLLACGFLLAVRSTQERRAATSWRLHDALEGFRFVLSRRVIFGAISLDLFVVLFGGATALLPAYAHDVLQSSPAALGLLRASPAVGAVITTAVLAVSPIRRHVGRWMFGGVVLFGLATIGFGLARSLVPAALCLALLGAGDMVSVYVRHLLVQVETPDAIRGRVSAVNSIFIGASNELGEFESGITAGWFGLIPAILLGGVASVGVAGVWAWRFKELSRMDRFPHDVQEAQGKPDTPELAEVLSQRDPDAPPAP